MALIVFLATQLGSVPYAIVATIKSMSSGIELNKTNMMKFELLGIDSNLGLMLMLLSFVFGFFALLLLVKPLHQRTVNETLTSRNKFDWNRFFFAVTVWGTMMIIGMVIDYFLNPGNYHFQFDPGNFIILVFIAVIFLSLQSSFEEILFRGYLQQGFAVLSKNAWIPIIITSTAFGLMHGMNPEVKEFGMAIMLPQYILLGLVLAIMTIMDDGLELAIGVHVVNNVLSALLVTHESSVLQTPALFSIDTVDPLGSLYQIVIVSFVFLFIMSNKYKWVSFKKLFGKVKPETV